MHITPLNQKQTISQPPQEPIVQITPVALPAQHLLGALPLRTPQDDAWLGRPRPVRQDVTTCLAFGFFQKINILFCFVLFVLFCFVSCVWM